MGLLVMSLSSCICSERTDGFPPLAFQKGARGLDRDSVRVEVFGFIYLTPSGPHKSKLPGSIPGFLSECDTGGQLEVRRVAHSQPGFDQVATEASTKVSPLDTADDME